MNKKLEEVSKKLEDIKSKLNADTLNIPENKYITYELYLVIQHMLNDLPDDKALNYEIVLNEIMGC